MLLQRLTELKESLKNNLVTIKKNESMELDELKQLWSQYDKKLNKSLKFNEELLRKMNLNKARQELQKPYILELITIVIIFLTIVFVTGFSIRLIEEIQFSLTGFAGILLGIIYLIFSIMKVNRFAKIDYYNSTIVKLQKDLSLLKTFVLRLRKIEGIMLPFLIIMILPIAFKAIHNINIFENLRLFIIEVCFILGISYPVGFWINRNVYDKKMKEAELFLKEIDNFEKEE